MSKKKYTKKQMEDEIDRRMIEAENWRITNRRVDKLERLADQLKFRVRCLEDDQNGTEIPQTQCGRVSDEP